MHLSHEDRRLLRRTKHQLMASFDEFKVKWKECETVYRKMNENQKRQTMDYLEQVMRLFTSQIPGDKNPQIKENTEFDASMEENDVQNCDQLTINTYSKSATSPKLTSIINLDLVKIAGSKGTPMESLKSTKTQCTEEWLDCSGKPEVSGLITESGSQSNVGSIVSSVNTFLDGAQSEVRAMKVNSEVTLDNPVTANVVENSHAVEVEIRTMEPQQETSVMNLQLPQSRPHYSNESNKAKSQRSEKSKVQTSTPADPQTPVDRSVDCEECGRTLSNSSNLSVHMRSHTGIKPFKCEICEKRFSTRANKRRHERSHQNLRDYQCDECPQKFSEKRTLMTHARIHSGDKPFKCTDCDETFTQQSSLIYHQMTHQGTRSYMCEECGATFKRKNQLSMHHRRRHLQVKDHACDVCGKTFVIKSDVKRHSKVHETERLCCPHCRLQFANIAALRFHLQTCRSKPRYHCIKCNKTFPNTAKLEVHLRTKEHLEKQNSSDNPTEETVVSSALPMESNFSMELIISDGMCVEEGEAVVTKGISDEILHQLLAREEIVQTDLELKMTEEEVNVEMLNEEDRSVVLIPVMVKEHRLEEEEEEK